MSDSPNVQQINSQLVDNLRPWFPDRNEPNYAWKSACASVMALPALRAFWPMSSVDYTVASRARDVAGGGYHLSDNNTVTFGSTQGDTPPGLAPYAAFVSASSQYLSRADGGAANWADIIGTEAYVIAGQRGLTFGGWFYLDRDTGLSQELIGKIAGGGVLRSYNILIATGTLLPQFVVTLAAANSVVNGTAGTTGAMPITQWAFVAARYTPSTEIKIWINDGANTNAVGIPASINDSTAAFAIGATGTPSLYMDGRASLCFLCAAALSDAIVGALYQNTRKIYGV
jgi:hypothetical protein